MVPIAKNPVLCIFPGRCVEVPCQQEVFPSDVGTGPAFLIADFMGTQYILENI